MPKSKHQKAEVPIKKKQKKKSASKLRYQLKKYEEHILKKPNSTWTSSSKDDVLTRTVNQQVSATNAEDLRKIILKKAAKKVIVPMSLALTVVVFYFGIETTYSAQPVV